MRRCFKPLVALTVAAALFVGVAGQAKAQIKSLFLGWDFDVAGTMSSILGADPRFDIGGSAAWEPQNSGLPTLATMLQYDSVLTWSNIPGNSAYGDLLADYVDAGGCVVLATFHGWASSFINLGRINTTGYNPLINPTDDAYIARTLGAYNSLHPIMAGVSSLSADVYAGDYLPGLDAGATLVAEWSDGRPLAAVNAAGNVTNITLFPNVNTFGHATGDWALLFRNALAQPKGPAVPEPGTCALLGAGAFGAVVAFRRRRAS